MMASVLYEVKEVGINGFIAAQLESSAASSIGHECLVLVLNYVFLHHYDASQQRVQELAVDWGPNPADFVGARVGQSCFLVWLSHKSADDQERHVLHVFEPRTRKHALHLLPVLGEIETAFTNHTLLLQELYTNRCFTLVISSLDKVYAVPSPCLGLETYFSGQSSPLSYATHPASRQLVSVGNTDKLHFLSLTTGLKRICARSCPCEGNCAAIEVGVAHNEVYVVTRCHLPANSYQVSVFGLEGQLQRSWCLPPSDEGQRKFTVANDLVFVFLPHGRGTKRICVKLHIYGLDGTYRTGLVIQQQSQELLSCKLDVVVDHDGVVYWTENDRLHFLSPAQYVITARTLASHRTLF